MLNFSALRLLAKAAKDTKLWFFARFVFFDFPFNLLIVLEPLLRSVVGP